MEPNTIVKDEQYISHPLNSAKEATSRLLKSNLRPLIKLVAVTLLLVIGLASVLSGLAYFNFIQSPNSPEPVTQTLVSLLVLTLLVLFVYAMVVVAVAANYIYARSQNLETASVRHALKVGQSRALVNIAASILMLIMVFFGLLVFIVPGIYLMLRLAYVYPIIANEKLGPIEAIKRSFYLTKNNLVDVIGVAAIAVILNSSVEIPNIASFYLQDEPALYIPLSILYIILAIIVGVITTAFIFFRYHQSDLEKKSQITKTYTSKWNYAYLAIGLVVGIIIVVASNPMQTYQMYTSPQEYVDLTQQPENELLFN